MKLFKKKPNLKIYIIVYYYMSTCRNNYLLLVNPMHRCRIVNELDLLNRVLHHIYYFNLEQNPPTLDRVHGKGLKQMEVHGHICLDSRMNYWKTMARMQAVYFQSCIIKVGVLFCFIIWLDHQVSAEITEQEGVTVSRDLPADQLQPRQTKQTGSKQKNNNKYFRIDTFVFKA